MSPTPPREPSRSRRSTRSSSAPTGTAAPEQTRPAPRPEAGRPEPRPERARPDGAPASYDQPPSAAPFVITLRRLLRHRALIVVALIVAIVAGILSGYKLSLSPLSLKQRGTSYGFANTELLIDSDRTRVGDVNTQLNSLGDRAQVFTALLSSDPVTAQIANRLGIPVTDVSSRVVQSGQVIGDNSDANDQLDRILNSQANYQLSFEAETSGPQGSTSLPLIAVTGKAPTAEKARQLVNAAGSVASTYFTNRATNRGVTAGNAARATAVGQAQGAQLLSGTSKAISLFVFLVVFAVLCGLILVFERFTQDWKVAGDDVDRPRRRAAA